MNSSDLEEKTKKIDEIYKNSLTKINQMGVKAVSLLKDIRKKREQKKIQDLSNKLKI